MGATEYVIKCPKCSSRAVALMKPVGIKGTYREPTVKLGVRRIACKVCGFAQDAQSVQESGYELWYTTDFRGHRLWAVNRKHLSFLISWFSDDLKKAELRAGDRAMVEVFPKWMIKNKSGGLTCLKRMSET